jgi:hypothetical protein
MRTSLIVGAGPGGIGPFVWAAQQGLLKDWLRAGVALFDRRRVIGGTLGRYAINSDSLGGAYLECLDAPAGQDFFQYLRNDPAAKDLEPWRNSFPPLALVDRYLHRLGTLLEAAISASSGSDFFSETDVRALHLRKDGTVMAEAMTYGGGRFQIEARTAVMALGGRQNTPTHFETRDGIKVELARWANKPTMTSDMVLTAKGLARTQRILEEAGNRRIVILGGSHSAYSVAWAITHFLPHVPFQTGDIVMLARRPPRIFYEDRNAADADLYPVSEYDICPRTLRVNRLGGLRGNGRDMWRRIENRRDAEPERRVSVAPYSGLSSEAVADILDRAALVIPAFGYRARTIPVFGTEGQRLDLRADRGGTAVDDKARIVLANGEALPNIFGIGLGSGFIPSGSMGGEPSFDGQANSLWLYHNHIGGAVYRGIHDYSAQLDLRACQSPWDVEPFTPIGAPLAGMGAALAAMADPIDQNLAEPSLRTAT